MRSTSMTSSLRLANKGVGGAVNLTYLRNGRGYNAPFNLVSPPEGGERNITRLEIECPLWGLTVADMSPASVEQAQAPTMSGVMITDVPQEFAGLRFKKGDVIFEVNGKPIADVDMSSKKRCAKPRANGASASAATAAR